MGNLRAWKRKVKNEHGLLTLKKRRKRLLKQKRAMAAREAKAR